MGIITKSKRVFLSFIFIYFSLLLFRPFIVSQIVLRGDGYLGYNMYKDAAREYRKALILDPNNIDVMNWLGYAYKNINDIEKAVDIYRKAAVIDPENIIALNDLGMICARDKKFNAAKEYFLKASLIRHDTRKYTDEEYAVYHSMSLMMLAICQEKLGEIDEAVKTSEEVLKYYPNNTTNIERLERLRSLKEKR